MTESKTSRGFSLLPDPGLAKRILTLSGPIVFAMLTQTAVNIADTFFVGKLDPSLSIPGQAALAYSLPLLWAFGGFLSSISVGTQAITGRRFGGKDFAAAGQVLTNSIIIATTTGIIASIVGYMVTPAAFGILTDDPAVQALGVKYAGPRMLGVFSMVATMSYKSFYDGIGKTHIHMTAAIVMNVLNIALNYFLIFGIWIFPEMKVEGAGWASLISTYVGLAIVAAWSFGPSLLKKYSIYSLRNFSPKISWEIIRLSVPSGFATVFVMSGFLIFFKIIGMLDTGAIDQAMEATGVYLGDGFAAYRASQEILLSGSELPGMSGAVDWSHMVVDARPAVFTAAAKVIMDITSIAFISSLAFGTATATLVSQSLGEGKPDLAERYGWDSAKIGAFFMSLFAIAVVVWPEAALDLISDDPEVIAAGASGMQIIGVFLPGITLAFVFTQALFGAGNSKFVMFVEAILHIVCLVPLTYALAIVFDFGFQGVWAAAATYIAALCVVMMWKFWEGSWKSIKL